MISLFYLSNTKIPNINDVTYIHSRYMYQPTIHQFKIALRYLIDTIKNEIVDKNSDVFDCSLIGYGNSNF